MLENYDASQSLIFKQTYTRAAIPTNLLLIIRKIRPTNWQIGFRLGHQLAKSESVTVVTLLPASHYTQWLSQPKNLGGRKMFDFRRIALFCCEKRLSRHKMTIFSRNFGGAWPLWLSLGYAYDYTAERTIVEAFRKVRDCLTVNELHHTVIYSHSNIFVFICGIFSRKTFWRIVGSGLI